MSELDIEDYPELTSWVNKYIADTEYLLVHYPFGFTVESVQNKLLDMQEKLNEAQARVKELEQVQEWISVENKIPYYGQIVLLKINNVVQEVTFIFDGADDCADWFEPHNMNEPGHGVMLDGKNRVEWLPLPPQPKE